MTYSLICRFSFQTVRPLTHFNHPSIPSFFRAMSSASQPQRLFQLRLDPLTGASEWVVVDEEGDEDPPPLSSTSYLDMLNDSRRNAAFRSAIEKTVTRPCHVLDIGAGTGLLSMLAARAMDSCGAAERAGSEGMVSACESYLPMVKLMRKVLRANGMEKKIRIFPRRSDELKVNSDLPSRADILVSEILDSELLGEGLIPTLRHAHDELLAANPGAVPYRATTYGQLVESRFLWQLYDLHGSEVHASDGIRLTPVGLETIIRVKRQQYAMHCNALSPEIRLLSEPFKIFEFNFCKRPDDHGEVELHIKATDSGTVHAIISWWVLQLDNEGTIFYSTAPQWISLPVNSLEEVTFVTDWCDHWKQCVWFTPGRGLTVSKDDRVFFEAFHSDTSISYSLRHSSLGIQIEDGGLAIGDSSLTLLPERVAIYGDKEWRLAMVTATKNALQGMVSPLCVIADDSVFLTILTASLSKSSYVISLFPGLCEKGFLYLQAVAKENGFSMDRVKVVGRRKQFLAIEDTNERKIDLFIGEPFYCGHEGKLPWQNLRFWNERTMLASNLSEDAVILPCKGILKACAMSLPDLWRSRCCLKRIEDFDHSAVNEVLGACGDLPPPNDGPCLPYFIWQCGESKRLSETFSILEFNFTESIRPCFGKAEVEFTMSGLCHGFALWIDWVMDKKNSIVISTGPDCRYWKQGVKLLSKPVLVGNHGSCSVGECCSAELRASFSPSTGEVIVESEFSSS